MHLVCIFVLYIYICIHVLKFIYCMPYIGNYIQHIYKFCNVSIHYILLYVIFWQLYHNSCVFLFEKILIYESGKRPIQIPLWKQTHPLELAHKDVANMSKKTFVHICKEADKETYIYEKRPKNMKRDLSILVSARGRGKQIKRDLCTIWKETYKREIYTYKKKPVNFNEFERDGVGDPALYMYIYIYIHTYIKRALYTCIWKEIFTATYTHRKKTYTYEKKPVHFSQRAREGVDDLASGIDGVESVASETRVHLRWNSQKSARSHFLGRVKYTWCLGEVCVCVYVCVCVSLLLQTVSCIYIYMLLCVQYVSQCVTLLLNPLLLKHASAKRFSKVSSESFFILDWVASRLQ